MVHPKAEAQLPPAAPDELLDIEDKTRLELYRQVLRLRRFEERAYDLFMKGLVKGTSHLSLGMEAIAAGFGTAMRRGRLHVLHLPRARAHACSWRPDGRRSWASCSAARTGVCGGKGGSMHLTSVEHGVMGSYAIIGAHLVIANGAAWSAKERGSGQVTVAFFGDGATNIGAFHEALNLAKVWELPIVFVCENNHWMEYTPISSVTAVEHPAADRASAYGMESIVIDGNDPDAVYDDRVAARSTRARAGGGPSLIEAMTYRHGGHSRADPGDYRPRRRSRPGWRATRSTIASGCSRSASTRPRSWPSRSETTAAVEEATEAAKAAPVPDLQAAYTNVWADGGWSWRN